MYMYMYMYMYAFGQLDSNLTVSCKISLCVEVLLTVKINSDGSELEFRLKDICVRQMFNDRELLEKITTARNVLNPTEKDNLLPALSLDFGC